jgi:hypothetical protein
MLVTLFNPFTWDSIRSVSRRRRNSATYVESTSGGNENKKIAEIHNASGSSCFCKIPSFFLLGISLGPSFPARIGTPTEYKRDTDSVSESSRDTDSATGDFFPARSTTSLGISFGSKKGAFLFSTWGQKGDFLFSTPGEKNADTSLVEFSLPLYWRADERDFFFLGDDDELVTGADFGANARESPDRDGWCCGEKGG